MKKLLVSFILAALLLSAVPVMAAPPEPIATRKEIRENLADGGEEYILGVELPDGVSDIESAFEWVFYNIEYKSNPEIWEVPEYWQTSIETIDLGTGDCEDKAILLAAFLKIMSYPEDEVRVACGKIGWGGPEYLGKHCWVEYWDGNEWIVYDPTFGVSGSWSAYRFIYAANHQWLFNWEYGIKERNQWPNFWH